ncbi:MAG TPA: endonuclease III [Spirochaetia bacterium]|nr:endonuclease III [Spirochaetia bacterium]
MTSALDSLAGLPSVSEVARENSDPFRVLVATMISLRTKDAVTRTASEKLLASASTPADLARLPEARIAKLIYPAGFYRTKARSLRTTARILVSEHGGKVPRTMDELLALPGVGRKTANLVLNLGYGVPGICVDTHVHRISNRTGWVKTKDPAGTEKALMEILPRRYWIRINELLVRFGQTICTPLSPHCSNCPIAPWCARVNVSRSR